MLNTTQKQQFLKLRSEIIEKDFEKLNPMQRKAVMATEGPLLLLAGAGSGKTTVLINRVANLIKYGRASDSTDVPEYVTDADLEFLQQYAATQASDDREKAEKLCALDPALPWTVIAITFTNKAADELKERLEKMLGAGAGDIWASTFHSACVRILRRDINTLGFQSSFTIYDTADSERVIKDVIKHLNLDEKAYPYKSVLKYISRAKDSQQFPEEYLNFWEKRGDYRMTNIARCYQEYQRRLKNSNALDFDDIIFYTVHLLETDTQVREYYQRKFRYVLIDEYQDTNNLQYKLASLLAGGRNNICVVGDDDQSIYRFRGATIENILSFEQQYTNARTIRLEQNYRSTETILTAANAVIKNNTGRKGKELWTDKKGGDRITLYTAMSEIDEADYVAADILRGYAEKRKWSDFAVLYRMNAQSNQIERAFKKNGIPYRIIGGTRFFERAEVKDMLAYLCVVSNTSDDIRLKRIINVPARGIGNKAIEAAEAVAGKYGLPIYSVISSPLIYPETEKYAGKYAAFAQLIEELRRDLTGHDLGEFYDLLMEKSGYMIMLQSKDEPENRVRAENVCELKTSIITYMEGVQEPTLAGFLDEVALYTDIENYDSEAQAVVMMTMHSAKGLEFPCVYVVGAEEGIFPGIRSIGEKEEMEEERRLCYVAITRAKDKLTLCHAGRRTLFGKTSANKLSRFVEEVPDELLEKKGIAVSYGDSFVQRESTYSSGWTGERSYGVSAPRVQKSAGIGGYYSRAVKSASQPAVTFSKGELIEHTAFGKGMVISVQPMGGDALIEVAFDNVGTKRLMAKSAGKHIKKLG